MGWALIAAGIFTATSAAVNWGWFMEHRNAEPLVRLFGRDGARVAYCVIGAAIVVLGGLMVSGIIPA